MEIKTFTSLESTFLSKLNEGFNTFDKLKDNVPFNEKTLNGIIESMISKNVIKFDSENKKYIYAFFSYFLRVFKPYIIYFVLLMW